MEREQEDNVRHELDKDFDVLRDLIYAPDPSSTGSNSIPLGHARPEVEPKALPLAPEPQDNDYDQQVRELAFDKRSKPKDRTKTEEEIALEEKEVLEKAERRRQNRMLGLEESDSEDEGKSRGKRKRGADDLDDDFEDGEWHGLGAGLGDDDEKLNGSDGDEPDGDESRDSGEEGEDDEGSDDGDSGDEDENGEEGFESGGESEGDAGEHEDLVTARATGRKSKNPQPSTSQELPFTFPCPSTHEEFLEIVEGVEDKDVPIVVQRIRTLYHTSLGIDNKFKLQVCQLAHD